MLYESGNSPMPYLDQVSVTCQQICDFLVVQLQKGGLHTVLSTLALECVENLLNRPGYNACSFWQ